MGITAGEFVTYVIRPTLQQLNLYTESFEKLLLVTAAAETGIGLHIARADQSGMGVYMISPQQHRQVWDQFLAFDPELASKVRGCASQQEFLASPDQELAFNLSYSTAIAAAIYLQALGTPCSSASPLQLAKLWQLHFKQSASIGTEDFLRAFEQVAASSMSIESN